MTNFSKIFTNGHFKSTNIKTLMFRSPIEFNIMILESPSFPKNSQNLGPKVQYNTSKIHIKSINNNNIHVLNVFLNIPYVNILILNPPIHYNNNNCGSTQNIRPLFPYWQSPPKMALKSISFWHSIAEDLLWWWTPKTHALCFKHKHFSLKLTTSINKTCLMANFVDVHVFFTTSNMLTNLVGWKHDKITKKLALLCKN